MSRISRVVVVMTALVSVFSALCSTADAVTWRNSGGSTFHADGSPGSVSVTGKTLSCAGSTATGVVTAIDFTGMIWLNAIHGSINYNNCSLAGTPYALSCTYGFNAAGVTGHAVNGTLDLDATLGSTEGCTATVGGVVACRFEGSIPATYHNPETGADARLTLPAALLTVTNGPSTTCPLGNGTTASQTTEVFTVTGVAPPTISIVTG